jgi:hypothetical protein
MRPTFQLFVVVVAALGLTVGGAFAGGVFYGRQSAPEASAAQAAATPAASGSADPASRRVGQGGGQNGGAMPAAGVIEKVDGGTLTVRTPSSGTMTVVVGPDTQISQMAPASTSDLQPGVSVTFAGQTGEGGNLVARSIQVGVESGGGPPGASTPVASPAP